jgi:hypothetical protein
MLEKSENLAVAFTSASTHMSAPPPIGLTGIGRGGEPIILSF